VQDGRLAVALPPPAGRGRYVFQLVEPTARGPEVAAQWTFVSGRPDGAWPPAPRRAPDDAAGARALLEADRARADVAPLAEDPALTRAATAFARTLCAGKVTAHRIRGGDSPDARARAAGYSGRVAENVARAASVAAAHRNLMISPSHRQSALDPAAAHVGLGVAAAPAEDGVGAAVCLVQLFGFE